MGLLNLLTAAGSTLGFNGVKPTSTTTAGGNNAQTFFKGSNLDLDGETPTTYADTAPENQGGKA